MAAIQPNSPPGEGLIAIFDYHGIKHIALIQSLSETGFTVQESNYKQGVIDTRFVLYTDKALTGFFDPKGSSYPDG